jgi:1-deoxy-D-xylulose-5-phosphate synthase
VLHAERNEQLAEAGLDVDGVTRAALALARSTGWSLPTTPTEAAAENGISSAGPGNGRGVRAGNERSPARSR